jgi:hypothetical protein
VEPTHIPTHEEVLRVSSAHSAPPRLG